MNSYIHNAPAWINFCARVLFVAACLLVITHRSQAQWTTNGNNINNTNSGNVGVGTTSPPERLSAVVDDGVTNGITQIFSIGHTTSGTPLAGMGAAFAFRAKRSDGGLAQIGYIAGVWEDPTTTVEDGALVFAPVLNSAGFGTERMRITSAGNVGIGTTSPTAASGYTALSLNNSTGALIDFMTNDTLKARLQSDGTTVYFNNLANGPIQIYTNSTERMRIDASGNVGIGVTSPTNKLHVGGNVTVDGNIAAKYQDVAEWVESSQELAAGTVVVLDRTRSNQVIASTRDYDTRVAGVISSTPGITLGEQGEGKVLVATTGRVKVRVSAKNGPIEIGDLLVTSAQPGLSAKNGPIEIGDLLVTSAQPGLAMKSEAVNIGGVLLHRPGTLIGKALEPLSKGEGEILVLLSLQ